MIMFVEEPIAQHSVFTYKINDLCHYIEIQIS